MIRLFIAIDLPEKIQQEIQGMGRSLPHARATPGDQLHLTLRFIGEVESSRVRDIEETLEFIAMEQFSLRVRGVGTFPPRGTPRVLWAGITPAEEVRRLRNSIEKKLAEIDIPREGGKYTPHITLARLKNSPLARVQQFLAGNAFLETQAFTVDRFHLYSSQLAAKGAIHRIIRTYYLIEKTAS